MKTLELYRKAALEMAYKRGATNANAKEIADKMRLVDIAEYIKQKEQERK